MSVFGAVPVLNSSLNTRVLPAYSGVFGVAGESGSTKLPTGVGVGVGEGGGGGGGSLGSSDSAGMLGSAGGTPEVHLNGSENVYGSASGGGGGGRKSGGDSAFSSLSGLFSGLGAKDGKGGTGAAAGSGTNFGKKGPGGLNPQGTADPDDYFTRIGVDDSIFKKVERRYEQTATSWALEHVTK